MLDYKLTFCNKTTVTGPTTTTAHVDLGQKNPDLGMVNCPKLGISVIMTKAWSGGSSPKVTFKVQEADATTPKGSTPGSFTDLLSVGPVAADGTFPTAFEIPLPISHKRFLKVVVTTTGTPTTGEATIAITDGTQKNPLIDREI